MNRKTKSGKATLGSEYSTGIDHKFRKVVPDASYTDQEEIFSGINTAIMCH